jgi:hypothetical protein
MSCEEYTDVLVQGWVIIFYATEITADRRRFVRILLCVAALTVSTKYMSIRKVKWSRYAP